MLKSSRLLVSSSLIASFLMSHASFADNVVLDGEDSRANQVNRLGNTPKYFVEIEQDDAQNESSFLNQAETVEEENPDADFVQTGSEPIQFADWADFDGYSKNVAIQQAAAEKFGGFDERFMMKRFGPKGQLAYHLGKETVKFGFDYALPMLKWFAVRSGANLVIQHVTPLVQDWAYRKTEEAVYAVAGSSSKIIQGVAKVAANIAAGEAARDFVSAVNKAEPYVIPAVKLAYNVGGLAVKTVKAIPSAIKSTYTKASSLAYTAYSKVSSWFGKGSSVTTPIVTVN